MLDRMELYQLRTFITVAESGTISRAAEQLHTSQPAVSAQIRALEDEFGVLLFVRTAKGVTLTQAGTGIKSRIERIVTEADELENQIRTVYKKEQRLLHIALNTESSVLRIDELVSAVIRKNPTISLQFTQNSTFDILHKIQDHKIDGGFVFGNHSPVAVQLVLLDKVKLVIAAPGSWHNTVKDLSLPQILGLPWILPAIDCTFLPKVQELFSAHSIIPKNTISSDNEAMTMHFIRTGMGISLLPEYIAQSAEGSGIMIIPGYTSRIELSFACLKNRVHSADITMLTVALKSVWRKKAG
ncbi:MAG: LysR family transcriptional regulator [Spirochaetales bacterium]|nr:LysR family transcriptional regulator [Spirochaetales bacterium]